jgi:hypothetical protein
LLGLFLNLGLPAKVIDQAQSFGVAFLAVIAGDSRGRRVLLDRTVELTGYEVRETRTLLKGRVIRSRQGREVRSELAFRLL